MHNIKDTKIEMQMSKSIIKIKRGKNEKYG